MSEQRSTTSTDRLVTEKAVRRAVTASVETPDEYAAGIKTVDRLAKKHRNPDEVAALARIILPSFVPTGAETSGKAWRNAARRAVTRCAAVVAAAEDGTLTDPSDLRDDSRTRLAKHAPDPAAAWEPTTLEQVAEALLRIPDEAHREAMRRAAVAVRYGDRDTLTDRTLGGRERQRIADAVEYLRGHRHSLITGGDWTRPADWTDDQHAAAVALADAWQHRADWTPGRSTGATHIGAQPITVAVPAPVAPYIDATGNPVSIPADRLAAALTRHADYAPKEATLAAAQHATDRAEFCRTRKEALTPERAAALAKQAARWDHRAQVAAALADEMRPAPAPKAERSRLAGLVTVPAASQPEAGRLIGWTLPTAQPMPAPTNVDERAALIAAQDTRPTGPTLAGRKALPRTDRPAQVAAWQTPGGTARPLAAPVVAQRFIDTGVPGTEVTAVTITHADGTPFLDRPRYVPTPTPTTHQGRPVLPLSGTDAAELSAALAAPAAVMTSAADTRTRPEYDDPSAALADRLAAAPRPGKPRTPSRRAKSGGSTGPTVPAQGMTR